MFLSTCPNRGVSGDTVVAGIAQGATREQHGMEVNNGIHADGLCRRSRLA